MAESISQSVAAQSETGVMSTSESGDRHVEIIELSPMMEEIRQQFSRELPDLLHTDADRWVLYSDTSRVGIYDSQEEAFVAANACPPEDWRVFWIHPGEDAIEEDFDLFVE